MISENIVVNCTILNDLTKIGGTVVLVLVVTIYVLYIRMLKNNNLEPRSWAVFFCDFIKLGVGQVFAGYLNISNTNDNILVAKDLGLVIDEVSMFLGVFILDELVEVPIGVFLGKGVQLVSYKYGIDSLSIYGRYNKNGESDLECGEINIWWVIAQVSSWLLCIFVSRYVIGHLMFFLFSLLGYQNPILVMGQFLYNIDLDCNSKIFLYNIIPKIIFDLAQIVFVDYFNSMKKENTNLEIPFLELE
jgi:hypothetical protein